MEGVLIIRAARSGKEIARSKVRKGPPNEPRADYALPRLVKEIIYRDLGEMTDKLR